MVYQVEWMIKPAHLEIRLLIFMIIGVSAGLPALVWSVGELIEHRRNGHRISAFIILLLLTDFTELYLSPYILIKDLVHDLTKGWTCWVLWSLWWSSRVCGLLLNQLVALEGILSVRYPLYTAAVFSSRWFRLFYVVVFVCLVISMLLLRELSFLYFFIPVSAFLGSVITWIISCGVSDSTDPHSHSSRKTDHHISVIFMFTLLMFYLPYISIYILEFLGYWDFRESSNILTFFHIPWLLVRLRLISDPLLCVLVCRQNLRVETPQTHDETSVV